MAISPDGDNTLSISINGDSSGLTEAVDSGKQSLLSLKGAVGGASVALGALAAGGIAKSIDAAASFESQMADVRKVTSEGTAGQLKEDIKDLSTEIPIAKGEMATLAEQAGKFGAEGASEIKGFVKSVSQIQTATDLAAEEAGKRFAKIAGAVGLPMSEIDKLGNATNKLADTMKTDAGEITDTATRASNTLSQQLGLGKDAVLSLSASMNEVSPSARRAAGSLRRAAEALMDPGKAEAIASAIGLSTEKFRAMREESPEKLMNKVAATMNKGGEGATKLRGSLGKAATAFSKIGKQQDATAQAQEAVNKQFEEGTSLQKEMDIRTDTLSGQYKLLKSTISNLAVTIGDAFLPIIKRVVSFIRPLITRVGEFVSGLSQMELVLGTVVPTISLLVGGVGLLVSKLGILGPVMSGVGTALSALLGPIGLVVAGVAGLVAVFSGKLPEILSTVDRVFGRLPDLIDRGVSRAIGWVRNTAIPRARQAFATLARRGAEAITLLGEWLPPRIRQAITAAQQWLTSTGAPLVRKGFAVLAREASKAFDVLAGKLPPILRQAVSAAMNWLRSTGVPLAKQAMRRLGEMAIQGLEVLRTKIYPVIRQAITAAMNWLQNSGVPLALNALRSLGQKAAQGFQVFKREILPIIVAGVNRGIDWVVNKGVPLAKKNLKTLAKAAGTAFSILKNQLLPFAIEAISAIASWNRNQGLPLLRKGLKFLAQKAVDAFGYLKQHLPPIARQAISALVSWIRTTGVPLARKALSFLADKAAVALGVLQRRLPPLVQQAISAIVSWVRNSGVPLARQALDFLAQQAGNAFAWLQTNLPPIINDAVSAAINWVRSEGVSMAKDGLSFLAEQAGVAWDAIKDIVSQAIQDAIGAMQSYLRNQATTDIKNAFRALGSGVRTVLTTLFSMGEGLGGVIATFITDSLIPYLKNDAAGDLKSGAKALFTTAIDVAKAIFKMGAGGTKTIGGVVKGLISDIVTYLKNDAGQDLKTAAEALFEVVTSAATGFAEGIIGEKGVIKTLIGDISSYIKNDAKDDVVDAFEALGSAIETAFGKAADAAVTAFNDALPDTLSIPEVTIGGQSIDIPSVDIPNGPTVGGGRGRGRAQRVHLPDGSVGRPALEGEGGSRSVLLNFKCVSH